MPRTYEHYFNPEEPMGRQHEDWTCAAASLAWLNRAMAIDRGQSESSAVELIGYPHNINERYGLMDGSGRRLVELLREDAYVAWSAWLGFSDVSRLAKDHALLIGGAGWYHWCGVRGTYLGGLALANPAPGWMGINQSMGEGDFIRVGPFVTVVVPLYGEFPSPDEDEV